MAIKINNNTVINDNRGFVDINNSSGLDKQIFTSTGTASAWVSGAVIGSSLDLGYVGIATYTSPGTFTVGTNCPSQISMIKIIGCGGGGNGGPGGNATPSNAAGGGGGGGASRLGVKILRVTNGQIFNITIGGANGNTTITNPGPVSVVTFTAGGNGVAGGPAPAGGVGGAGGNNGVPVGAVDLFAQSEVDGSIESVAGGPEFTTQISPDQTASEGGAGGGGASNTRNYFYWDDIRIGTGGAGGPTPRGTGAAATGRGAGGGGGGGADSPTTGAPGGSGSPGIVIVVY
jgi:hypothetical protein